jgi:hypothetical protein
MGPIFDHFVSVSPHGQVIMLDGKVARISINRNGTIIKIGCTQITIGALERIVALTSGYNKLGEDIELQYGE